MGGDSQKSFGITNRGPSPLKGGWDMNAEREDKLEAALKEIAEMKIPYCDADDVAHRMRDIARDVLADKLGDES